MIAEDIQIEVIANKIKWITLYPFKKMIFFFWNILKELVASTNVKNVQTMVIVARIQRSSTWMNIRNHEADMLGFKTLRYNYFKLYKLTNCT